MGIIKILITFFYNHITETNQSWNNFFRSYRLYGNISYILLILSKISLILKWYRSSAYIIQLKVEIPHVRNFVINLTN